MRRAERIFAERGPHPVVAWRRVALVEHEVEDFEHRGETGGELGPAGHLERDARLGESLLGPDDSLGDGRLRDEERARDLGGLEAPDQPERERNARLGRENRVTGREHEAEEVVADVIVDRSVEIGHDRLLTGLDLAAELLVLAFEDPSPAQPVDRAVLRGRHEPGARVVRDSRLRPPLERGEKSVLREILGKTDVAHDPRQPGDEPGRLDPPDRVDRAVRVGGRHGRQSHHPVRRTGATFCPCRS
jgi:hypothetical protein